MSWGAGLLWRPLHTKYAEAPTEPVGETQSFCPCQIKTPLKFELPSPISNGVLIIKSFVYAAFQGRIFSFSFGLKTVKCKKF